LLLPEAELGTPYVSAENGDTLERVATVMRSVFRLGPEEPIMASTTSADIDGWDSLSHSVLIMNVEDAFGVDLPLDRVFALRNVGELVDLIEVSLDDSA
jgi:acyl carrier protein